MSWLIKKKPEDKSILERFPFWIGTIIGSLFIVLVFITALADINRSVSQNNSFYELFTLDSLIGSHVRTPKMGTVMTATAPQLSLISPVSGSIVSGAVSIVTGQGKSMQVNSARFLVDGKDEGVIAIPYMYVWDTTKAVNGPHAIKIIAMDATGNEASVGVEVVVAN